MEPIRRGRAAAGVDAVVDALAIAQGDTVVDGTFGAGGYTRAMLAAGAASRLAQRPTSPWASLALGAFVPLAEKLRSAWSMRLWRTSSPTTSA